MEPGPAARGIVCGQVLPVAPEFSPCAQSCWRLVGRRGFPGSSTEGACGAAREQGLRGRAPGDRTLPMAAIYPTRRGLNQHRCMISRLSGSETQLGLAGLRPRCWQDRILLEAPGNTRFLALPDAGGHLSSLACGPFLHLQTPSASRSQQLCLSPSALVRPPRIPLGPQEANAGSSPRLQVTSAGLLVGSGIRMPSSWGGYSAVNRGWGR